MEVEVGNLHRVQQIKQRKLFCCWVVFLTDTESPVFTPCPPNIERSTDAEGKFKYPMWPRPTAIDNSGQTPEITTSYSFMMFPLETDTPIEYFATDRAGNTAKCIFYVKIKGEIFSPSLSPYFVCVCALV